MKLIKSSFIGGYITYLSLLGYSAYTTQPILIPLNVTDTALAIHAKPKELINIDNIHTQMGIPKDNNSIDDRILFKKQYTISYNPERNVANWASWNLNINWIGDTNRVKKNFIIDKDLPNDILKISSAVFDNTQYNKGHIVPSKDRSNSKEDNASTFVMTNVYPQYEDLNQGPWQYLEAYCQKICTTYNKELYIIAGGLFYSNSSIGNYKKVSVPDSCYKIIVILGKGEDVKDVTTLTNVLAVVMPNKIGIRTTNWRNYITTVDLLENSSGYNFLSNIPDSIETILEIKKFTE